MRDLFELGQALINASSNELGSMRIRLRILTRQFEVRIDIPACEVLPFTDV
jgi:hypothetical protein